MKDLLCEECRDRIERELNNRGERNQREIAYKLTLRAKKIFTDLLRNLELDMF